MPVPLSCPCGAQFEVEDALASQGVSCPECQRALEAPSTSRLPVRTSGLAVASVIVALVLAFTGVGTLLAVALGIAALVSISRSRGQVAGTGYALFGIGAGLIFTALVFLAVIKQEIFPFDPVRDRLHGYEVDRAGPREVVRSGYAITRPSESWGVAKQATLKKLTPDSDLLLVHSGREALVDVSPEQLTGQDLDAFREKLLDDYRERQRDSSSFRSFGTLTVRKNQRLTAAGGLELAELVFDMRVEGNYRTYVVRLANPRGTDRVYVISGSVGRDQFSKIETEIRRALDSFRLVKE